METPTGKNLSQIYQELNAKGFTPQLEYAYGFVVAFHTAEIINLPGMNTSTPFIPEINNIEQFKEAVYEELDRRVEQGTSKGLKPNIKIINEYYSALNTTH